MIAPRLIERFTQSDSTSMGTVGDRTITVARFKLDDVEDGYALADVNIRNTGGSAGRADLTLNVDHRIGPAYDFTLLTWKDFGNGAATDKSNIKLAIKDWELRVFTFLRNSVTGILDELVFAYSNPNTQIWAIDIGLVDIKHIVGP